MTPEAAPWDERNKMSFHLRMSVSVLLVLLACAMALVILLHLLRRRRLRRKVSTLLLWRRLAVSRRQVPARRSLFSRQLALQLLAVNLLLFAAAGPSIERPVPARQRIVLILHNDTGMDARLASGPTRWEAACKHIRRRLSRLAAGDELTLLVTAPAPARLAGPTLDRTEILRRLDDGRPVHTAGRLDEAVAQGLELLDNGTEAEARSVRMSVRVGVVEVYSDTAPRRVVRAGGRAANVIWHRIGGDDADNVGIVAFDVERSPPTGHAARIFAALQNAGRSPADVTLSLRAFAVDGSGKSRELIAPRTLTLAPGARRAVLLAANLAGVAALELEAHSAGDALHADDVVRAVRSRSRPLLVAVIGPAPRSVFAAIEAEGASAAVSVDDPRDVPDEAALVVFYQVDTASLPARPVLVIDPPRSVGPLRVNGTPVRNVQGLEVAVHPFMDGPLTRLGDVTIKKLRNVKRVGNFQVLATTPRGVAALGRWFDGPQVRYYAGFALDGENTNWSRQATWPIFMAKVLRDIRGHVAGPGDFTWARTGRPAARQIPGLAFDDRLRGSREQSLSAGEALLLADLYRLEPTGRKGAATLIAANLLDARETDIRPSPPVVQAAAGVSASASASVNTVRAAISLQLPVLLLGLALLLLEWGLYEAGREGG